MSLRNYLNYIQKQYDLITEQKCNKLIKNTIAIVKTDAGISYIMRCLDNNIIPSFCQPRLTLDKKRIRVKRNIGLVIANDELIFKRKQLQQLALENKTLYDQLNFKLDEHREEHQACTDLLEVN